MSFQHLMGFPSLMNKFCLRLSFYMYVCMCKVSPMLIPLSTFFSEYSYSVKSFYVYICSLPLYPLYSSSDLIIEIVSAVEILEIIYILLQTLANGSGVYIDDKDDERYVVAKKDENRHKNRYNDILAR